MACRKVEREGTLDVLVRALCLDYSRRERAISEKSVSHRTDTEFRYYNFKIFDAAAEVVGEMDAELYIKEIGEKCGYAKSEFFIISEGTYKLRKRAVMDNIAKKLHLSD
jgi:hypothetical protein